MGTGPYLFYATEVSYFSAIVRPALHFKALNFQEIEPTSKVYREIIRARTGMIFIPIVVTPDDETLQDTSEILAALERLHPEPPLFPATPVQAVTAHLIELFANEFCLLPAMHYRWSFEESEAKARADFARATGNAEASSRFADRMKGSLPGLGVSSATIPAIEAHLAELLAALCAHFREHDFLLGGRMSLADCGLMGPLYPHLYLDAVPGRLLRETAPEVCAWIERMNAPDFAPGSLVAGDALPASLLPVLELMGRDMTPMLAAGLRAFDDWAQDQAPHDFELPRMLGQHEFPLRDARGAHFTSSYTPWMVQHSTDLYAGLDVRARASVDDALADTGLLPLLGPPSRRRLSKRNFKLFLDAVASD